MKTSRFAALLTAFAGLFLAVPATAQDQAQPSPLVITAQNLMAGDAQHQEMAEKGGDQNALLPGDIVHYRLTFTNTTDVPVRNVEFKDPLPAGLRYLGGSASADRDDVVITYSIDAGQTYSAEPMIEEIVDGERVHRRAPAEMFTHIRWVVRGWVQPGAQVTAEFRAQLPPEGEAPEEPGEPN